MRTNVKEKSVKVAPRTHNGAVTVTRGAVTELRRAVMANMLFEDTFYESGVEIARRIPALVSKVTFEEFCEVVLDAREKFKLRHVPLYLLVVGLKVFAGKGKAYGELISRTIQRADEMGELIAIYQKHNGKDASLAKQLKMGVANAFDKFTEYQFAKYNRDNASVKLRDAMFLTHPRPKTEEKTELYKRIAANTLATPNTWETRLSAGENKKAVFTDLIETKQLGALAFLRNLRNMQESGVSDALIRKGLTEMKADRVLPFRFISAAKYASKFEPELELAMFKCLAGQPAITGNTALLIDHSGSMRDRVSHKSDISRFDAAAALAMILRERCVGVCRVFTFAEDCIEVAPRRGFALIDEVKRVINPVGTKLGKAVKKVYADFPECERIIVITDEQSGDRPGKPKGTGYIINVAAYQNGIGYGDWLTISGWSEAILDYIQMYEETQK